MAYKTFANGFPLPASDLNNYLMNQSVIVFSNSTARSADLATPVEGMVTYLEDTDSLELWTGSSWDVVNDNTASIPKSTVTTAGDLIVADGASSVTRLGVGSEGQVLSISSGEPVWENPAGGGGMTLISSTTLSGVSTTISSIPQTYKNLYLVVSNAYCDNTTDPTVYYDCRVVPNGSIENFWGFMSGVTITATTAFPIISNISSNTSSKNAVAFQIIDYTSTDYKQAYCFGSYFTDRADSGGSTSGVNNRTGVFTHTSGITSLEITTSDPAGFTGGNILLYGVS